jgi:hypothetical protein
MNPYRSSFLGHGKKARVIASSLEGLAHSRNDLDYLRYFDICRNTVGDCAVCNENKASNR